MERSVPKSCVLFDMDGVIIDSEPMQMQAFEVLMSELGCHIGREDFLKLVGRRAHDNFAYLIDKFGLKEKPAQLVERKNELYEKILQNNLHPVPGVQETLSYLSEKKIPLAVVSGSVRKHVDFVLRGLGLSSHFTLTMASEDVTCGKPDPEGFLRAASEFGALPENSFVIEDSEAGVIAGWRGGFKVLAIPTPFTETHDFAAAFHICASMYEALDYLKQTYA